MNPSHRRAGIVQGIILVACSWLAVMASGALLGPVLPTIARDFGGAAAEYQVAAIVAMPPLFVAIFSWPMGVLSDRVGARRVLMVAALLYGAVGIAPYFLHELQVIVWTRQLVGIAEAGVMTCSYALIGSYYSGRARAMWYALTTGTAPVVALAAIALGGGLGERDWHNVFLVYLLPFALFLGTMLFLWEPKSAADQLSQDATQTDDARDTAFRWPPFAGICLLSTFVMTAFLITVIQTGSLMTERGLTSPAAIGRWQALASLANPAGAAAFMFLPWRFQTKLLCSLSLMSVGLASIGLRTDWQSVIWGGTIANLGCGMVLPTVVSWGLMDSPTAIRGRLAGILMACNFFGQFLSPYAMVWLKGIVGSLSTAVYCYALICGAGAVLTLVVLSLRPRRSSPSMVI